MKSEVIAALILAGLFVAIIVIASYIQAYAHDGEHYPAEIIRVVDGDTYDAAIVVFQSEIFGVYQIRKERLRLRGVDTPELRGHERPRGLAAADWVRDRIESRIVTLHLYEQDRWGRTVADVEIAGEDLGRLIVENGMGEPCRTDGGAC